MSATASLVSARLPICLSTMVIDYLGQWKNAQCMAMLGQYENCRYALTKYGGVQNDILLGACHGGHSYIVELAIAHWADAWNWGLIYACQGGHLGIVSLIIAHGTNALNWGLATACYANHSDIAKFLIARGADTCKFCQRPISEHPRER